MERCSRTLAFVGFTCLAWTAQAQLYDFNADGNGFTSSFNTDAFDGPWTWGATFGVGGSGGWSTEGQATGTGHPNTTDLTSPVINVATTGPVTLSFDHRYSFEFDGTDYWDGGALFLSVNGGDFAYVPNTSFTSNGYVGAPTVWDNGSQLGGQMAFAGTSTGYANGDFITSVANLGTLNAGDTFQIRFRAAFDENTSGGSPDWAIDNVQVTAVPEPATLATLAIGGLALLRRRRR